MKTLIIIALLAAPAFADTVDVDPSMTAGEITTAIMGAAEGDTIKFAKGTYLLDDFIGVSTSGVTLVGSKAVLDAQHMATAINVRADDVTVQGFRIVNGMPNGIFVGTPLGPEGSSTIVDNVTITKNRIDGCSDSGIRAFATNATITKNRSGGNGEDGIYLTDEIEPPEGPPPEPSVTTISSNQCVGNNDKGIDVDVVGSLLIIEKNICSTNDDDGMDIEFNLPAAPEGKLPPEPEPSVIARNKVNGNGDDGMDVNSQMTGPCVVRVEKNTAHMNMSDGIDCDGEDYVVTGNKADFNQQEGFDLRLVDSEVTKNKATANKREGFKLNNFEEKESGAEGNSGQFGGNLVESNQAKTNGHDGFEVNTTDNMLFKNKALKNFGDGIDIVSFEEEGTGFNSDNDLDGNTCNGNNHEGIDNGGQETKINNNKCKGNAFGDGPDIAGTGDFDTGNVAKGEFNGNSFDEGGETTPAVRDDSD